MDAILNISISPMMPRWHHSVSMNGHIGEHIYSKTFCAGYFFGLHPKSSFGNLTIRLPRKSVVRITDRPDMTLDVYRGRKTTTQHYSTENSGYLSRTLQLS